MIPLFTRFWNSLKDLFYNPCECFFEFSEGRGCCHAFIVTWLVIAFAFTGFAVQIKAVPGQFAEAETLLSSALL